MMRRWTCRVRTEWRNAPRQRRSCEPAGGKKIFSRWPIWGRFFRRSNLKHRILPESKWRRATANACLEFARAGRREGPAIRQRRSTTRTLLGAGPTEDGPTGAVSPQRALPGPVLLAAARHAVRDGGSKRDMAIPQAGRAILRRQAGRAVLRAGGKSGLASVIYRATGLTGPYRRWKPRKRLPRFAVFAKFSPRRCLLAPDGLIKPAFARGETAVRCRRAHAARPQRAL